MSLGSQALQTEYEILRSGYQDNWRKRYSAHVERIHAADAVEWNKRTFQRMLWEDDSVSGIGRGSVKVEGAFDDLNVARLLLDIRSSSLPSGSEERAERIQRWYEEVIAAVYPKHAERRPRAKVIRLLAALRPDEMTCLLDQQLPFHLQSLIGAPKASTGVVGQHVMIRERLRTALGSPKTVAERVDHSVLCWFLWERHAPRADEGAIEISKPTRDAADLPTLSLRPPGAQRRSLTCVQKNVNLLVAVVRESEQGITRDDLISAIMQKAPHLQSGSASNIISQAQGGLGLIQITDGAYRPTERGLELLTNPNPAQVLRAPLIGRVFGVGHLLLYLAKEPAGVSQQEMAKRLQSLVPTWKTPQPGSYIVMWAKSVGLVTASSVAGQQQLVLTEDGAEYAAALPDDFEERWRITDSGEQTFEEEPQPDLAVSTTPSLASSSSLPPYTTADITAEGCFLEPEWIDDALAQLRVKKNLILQGPPGTGKTWLAKRLGYALLGARDTARLTAIQFQPSLSYEDFVRGYRPDADGRLTLADGMFLQMIDAAKIHPDDDFVLVIEEINRGNPGQIFGELLTLIEGDKRSPEEAVRLAYAQTPRERVYVPENLYILGTMNLADRSLAMVDLALRRRFAFRTLAPVLGPRWKAWCVDQCGFDAADADLIAARMAALADTVSGDRSLGEQFRVGHSYVTPNPKAPPANARDWFRQVVETEIGPLLDEYWYDAPGKAASARAALLAGV